MSCCCAKPSSVRFLQPWDGDILNRHDGKAVEGNVAPIFTSGVHKVEVVLG